MNMAETVFTDPLVAPAYPMQQLTGAHSYEVAKEDEAEADRAWNQGWDDLQLKKTWHKKTLQRNPEETAEHFAYRLIYSYLVSKGMREIGQFPEMDWEEDFLGAVILRSHYLDAIRYANKISGTTLMIPGGWSDAAYGNYFRGICRRAARFALENFDPDTYKKKQAQGRKGGMMHRVWDLEQYLETYGMSKKETVKHLGISESSVANMRRHFKKVLDIDTGEILAQHELGINTLA